MWLMTEFRADLKLEGYQRHRCRYSHREEHQIMADSDAIDPLPLLAEGASRGAYSALVTPGSTAKLSR